MRHNLPRTIFFMLWLCAAAAAADKPASLKAIPKDLHWKVAPVDWKIDDGAVLTITAGKGSNEFVSPLDGNSSSGAPKLMFQPDEEFVLSAKVTVDFQSTWDAGFLAVQAGVTEWAKLCLEMSNQGNPKIVSVVTHGVSDDSTGVPVEGTSVYLKVAKIGPALFFYYSPDGKNWTPVRAFRLSSGKLEVGFAAQAPVGERCTVKFTEIRYSPKRAENIWTGE